MDCRAAAISPKGSPVIIRVFPQNPPPPLDLSVKEKIHDAALQRFHNPCPENHAFTSYFKAYLQGPFDIKEAKWILLGPHADFYRELAVNQLIDCPSVAFEFIKEVQDPLLKMALFESLLSRLASVDCFDCILEGLNFLTDQRKDIAIVRCALSYLDLDNHPRALNLYFIIASKTHKRNLYRALFEKSPDKIGLVSSIIRYHLNHEEIEEAIRFVQEEIPQTEQEDLLLQISRELIEQKKERYLQIVLRAAPLIASQLMQLKTSKRKQPVEAELDPVVKYIQSDKPLGELLVLLRQKTDRDKGIACLTLMRLARYQDAYYFAREINHQPIKEQFLSRIAIELAEEDNFSLVKEIFPQVMGANDLKLKIAYLYLSRKIERTIEIFSLLTSRPHRIQLFIQIAKRAKHIQELDAFIGAILTPFLDSGDIHIAINIVRYELYGIDVEYEIYRMGLYLINQNKREKIGLILEQLTVRRKDLETMFFRHCEKTDRS